MYRSAKISLKEGDNPKLLARNFCKAYQLHKETEYMLAAQLQEHYERVTAPEAPEPEPVPVRESLPTVMSEEVFSPQTNKERSVSTQTVNKSVELVQSTAEVNMEVKPPKKLKAPKKKGMPSPPVPVFSSDEEERLQGKKLTSHVADKIDQLLMPKVKSLKQISYSTHIRPENAPVDDQPSDYASLRSAQKVRRRGSKQQYSSLKESPVKK